MLHLDLFMFDKTVNLFIGSFCLSLDQLGSQFSFRHSWLKLTMDQCI